MSPLCQTARYALTAERGMYAALITAQCNVICFWAEKKQSIHLGLSIGTTVRDFYSATVLGVNPWLREQRPVAKPFGSGTPDHKKRNNSCEVAPGTTFLGLPRGLERVREARMAGW